MSIRIRPNVGRRRKPFFSGDFFRILGIFLTIQATVGVSLLGRNLLHLESLSGQEDAIAMISQGEGMAMVYVLFCRMGGGLAWLFFSMLAVTGFQYTRDIKKYLIRVGLVALISEVPYDLCSSGAWFSFQSQNPVFAILAGLAVLFLVEDVIGSIPGRIALLAGGLLWAVVLQIQSGYLIVGTMYLIYFLEDRALLRDLLILALSALDILILGASMALASTIIPVAVGVLLLHLYDDDSEPRLPKWLSYGIYPLHLIVIAVISMTVFAA